MSLSNSSSVALSSASTSTGVTESHLELLANISQCSDSKCSNDTCVQFKENVCKLEAALGKGPDHLNLDNIVTLRLLHEHYTFPCCLPNCRVPWCRLMSYRCLDSLENTQQELTMLINHPMLTLLPPGTKFDEFVKLDPELSSVLEEWEDWLVIAPLSPSYTVALTAPVRHQGLSGHCVVKMVALQEEDNQLQAVKKLRGLRHPHVISHIWAASCSRHNIFVTCTEYLHGRSVADLTEKQGHLSYTQTRFYFLQVLSAAQRLHELNIVFLNWKCSNLLLDVRGENLKVSNFSTAVDLSSGNADVGTIKLTLPADIVPAELLQNGPLSHKSDSWGLACIVHEMLAGVRPWYHLRHESHEHIRRQILTHTPPDVPAHLPECLRILTNTCLQRSPDLRLSVTEMMAHFHTQLD